MWWLKEGLYFFLLYIIYIQKKSFVNTCINEFFILFLYRQTKQTIILWKFGIQFMLRLIMKCLTRVEFVISKVNTSLKPNQHPLIDILKCFFVMGCGAKCNSLSRTLSIMRSMMRKCILLVVREENELDIGMEISLTIAWKIYTDIEKKTRKIFAYSKRLIYLCIVKLKN